MKKTIITLCLVLASTLVFANKGTRVDSQNGHNHQWYFNGKPLMGCNAQTIVAMADGVYAVTYVDAQGIIQKESKKIDNTTCKVFLIGDSTVADYSLEENYMEKRHPINGWGQVFQPFLAKDSLFQIKQWINADSAVVIDKAKGGRSTRTFFQEGRWREVYDQLNKGDLVLIQFGHNDGAEQKTERYVPIEGYQEFLRLFVSQAREKGALPILVTPVARNYPWKDGKLENVHGQYPEAMKAVAVELNVPLIDLNELSMAYFTKKGQDYVTSHYFMNFGPNLYQAYPDGQKDNTHFQKEGAQAVAQLVYEALKKTTNTAPPTIKKTKKR